MISGTQEIQEHGSLPAVVGDMTNTDSQPILLPSVAEICARLKQLQTQRRQCIRTQQKLDRAIESFMARYLGYNPDLPPEKRKAIFKLAARLRGAIERDTLPRDARFGDDFLIVIRMVKANATSRSPWDDLRRETETEMERLAKDLPVWKSFAAGVRGFGALGLAVVVGEAVGPAAPELGDYRTPAGLWKRMGLAPDQRRYRDKEKAIKAGYNPRRRAEIWSFFTDSMFRAVWRSARCLVCEETETKCKCASPQIVPAHPIGPYGARYGQKKSEYVARGWKGMKGLHPHWAAAKVMTKDVIRDLWVAWRRCGDQHRSGTHIASETASPLREIMGNTVVVESD